MNSAQIKKIRPILEQAIKEDCPTVDITSNACVSESASSSAMVVAKSDLTLAGLIVFREVMRIVDPHTVIKFAVKDGEAVTAGTIVLRMKGSSRSILKGERVALNYLQRMSGTATLTAQFVAQTKGTKAQILDTRKTTPNMRMMEKYAVVCGGGVNHRYGLSDAPLIKENHIRAAGGIAQAVERVKKKTTKPVILEVTNRAEVLQGLEAEAEILLLDNMTPAQVASMVKLVAGRALIEVSGGVNLKTVRKYAEAGADRISVGALTHSAPAADLSLLFV